MWLLLLLLRFSDSLWSFNHDLENDFQGTSSSQAKTTNNNPIQPTHTQQQYTQNNTQTPIHGSMINVFMIDGFMIDVGGWNLTLFLDLCGASAYLTPPNSQVTANT